MDTLLIIELQIQQFRMLLHEVITPLLVTLLRLLYSLLVILVNTQYLFLVE